MDGLAYVGPAERTVDAILDRLRDARGYITVDVETVSVADKRIIGIGIGLSPVEALYVCAWQGEGYLPPSPYLPQVLATLRRPDLTKLIFNIGFDHEQLAQQFDASPDPWKDVSIMCHVQGLPNALDECVSKLLYRNHQIISDILPKGKNMLSVDFAKTAWKCLQDCTDTYALWTVMKGPEWDNLSTQTNYWDGEKVLQYDVTTKLKAVSALDHAIMPVLWRASKRGIKLDQERLREHHVEASATYYKLRDICQQKYGFNPGSNQQVGYVLAARGNFFDFTPSGRQYQVDDEALVKCGDPLAHVVLAYRKVAKLRSTYMEPWLDKERALTNFRIDLATGRTASFDRNLQNVPSGMRDIFITDGGGDWLWWDFSQIEMRIFAYLSNETKMLTAFRDTSSSPFGRSVHEETLSALWPGQKKKLADGRENPLYLLAKTFNFAMIYNAESSTLASNTGLAVDVADMFRNQWLEYYDAGYRWMQEIGEYNANRGWAEAIDGRRMFLPDAAQRGWKHRVTCGINYPVQGSAAWALKKAWLLQDILGFDIPLQVHDEFLTEGEPDIPNYLAELIPNIHTPFEIKRGERWT